MPRKEKEKLGCWEAVAGRGSPWLAGVQSETGLYNTLARACTLTHLDCDCPSSAVPSKVLWPLSLKEESGWLGPLGMRKMRQYVLMR